MTLTLRAPQKRRGDALKRVPSFWWDFKRPDEIIVESDSDKYPVVGRFKYHPSDGFGCAEIAIQEADKLIAELTSGRKVPRAC